MKTDRKNLANPTTVALKKIVKEYSGVFFHAHRNDYDKSHPYHGSGDCAVFVVTGADDHGAKKALRSQVDVFGLMGNGYTDAVEEREYDGRKYEKYTETYRPEKGFWSFSGSQERLRDALDSVPNHATVTFQVKLDNLTTDNHVKVRFHGDAVYLRAAWGEGRNRIERTFLLDTETGPHNTARFGSPGVRD